MSKKNLLILAYYYPPNNNTAANRINSWTEHLPKDKYYPTVITWDWERSRGQVEVSKHDGYEVHSVPRKLNLFNRIVSKASVSNGFLKKPLLLIQLFLANTSEYVSNSEDLNAYLTSYLQLNKVDVLISSGSPFHLHVLSARQKRKNQFYHIADYRDPWSNNEHIYKDNVVFDLLKKIDTRIERKTSKQYDYILAASDFQRQEICDHIGFPQQKSDTMLNGFIKSKYSGVKESRKNLQILFSGTFYLTQPIEDILEIINDKLKEGLLPKQTKIIFLGTAAVPSVADRVRKAIVGYEEYYEITPRIEHSKAMEIQLSSDLLVMPSHIGIKGIPSSKLFDYVSTGLPVLLYPNDGDVIEEILNTTKLGLICNTKNEISHTLDKLVQAKEQGATIVTPELDTINMYSRKEQTKVLERTIDKLLSEE